MGPTRKALYYQKTPNHELEFDLVGRTVLRESCLGRFQAIERAVKQKRRVFDEDTRLEMLILLNEMRELTLRFVEGVMEWQKMFVKAKRPRIMSEDYLIEMARSTEFINASPLRKYYNFAVSRQNVFLLLMTTGKPKDPMCVSPRINEELQKLSDPDMDRVIEAYKLFKKCLPCNKFASLLPLSQWMKSLWVPNVIVKKPSRRTLPPVKTPLNKTMDERRKTSQLEIEVDNSNRQDDSGFAKSNQFDVLQTEARALSSGDVSKHDNSQMKGIGRKLTVDVPVETYSPSSSQSRERCKVKQTSSFGNSRMESINNENKKNSRSSPKQMRVDGALRSPASGKHSVISRSKSPTSCKPTPLPRTGSESSMLSNDFMTAGPAMSTAQLRKWYKAIGDEPVKMVETTPAFPTKKKLR